MWSSNAIALNILRLGENVCTSNETEINQEKIRLVVNFRDPYLLSNTLNIKNVEKVVFDQQACRNPGMLESKILIT